MSDTLALPETVGELEQLEDKELAELETRIHRLREQEREVADESREPSEALQAIRDWVLEATRDQRFADQLLLGQLAILWLEVEDAVRRESQDDFEMAVTMIDEAIRRADRRSARKSFDESEKKAIEFVLDVLPELSSNELAPLFGVSERTVRGWRAELPERTQVDTERLSTLAQALFDVRPSTTARGALRWFERPLYQLEGRSPIDLLNDSTRESYDVLRALARGGRGQGA